MSRKQRYILVSVALLALALKFVHFYDKYQSANKELVNTISSKSHSYSYFYNRRGNYNIIERDGRVIFDSRKDGVIQGIGLINGVACKQFYDAVKRDTGCDPLP
jgi:hypothetical protein